MARLSGKTALVTGAGGGIGRGIAMRFAAEGARVGVLDVSAETAERTTREITAAGGHALALPCDLRDPERVRTAVARLVEQFGPVQVVVNNAAIMPGAVLHQTSLEDWDAVFAVNVRGAYLVNREVIPSMIERGGGSIIHMASVTGVLGLPGLAAYSATKAALIGLTRAMSTDYAKYGIRVNSVAPGPVWTPLIPATMPPEKVEGFGEQVPMGRAGQPAELAPVYVLLASDEASYISGARIAVTGGKPIL